MTKRDLPIAGILTVLAFMLVEMYANQMEFRATVSTGLAERIISSKTYLVRTDQVQDQDILILGDSFASTGVDTRNLSKTLSPVKLYNLAMVATASLGGTYYILKEYLQKSRPPKTAILLLTNNALSTSLGKLLKTRRLARHFNSVPQIIENFYTLGLKGGLDSLYWRIFPSHNWNSHMRDIAPSGWSGWKRVLKRRAKAERRINDVKKMHGFTGVNENKMRKPKPKGAFVKPVTSKYLNGIFNTLNDHDIIPYCAVATLPLHAYTQVINSPKKALRTTLDTFADLQDRGCIVLDTPSAFEKRHFGSLTHFNIKGAEIFAQTLSNLIPNRLTEFGFRKRTLSTCESTPRRISSSELGASYVYQKIERLDGSAIAWKLPAYIKGKKIRLEYLAPPGTQFTMSLSEDFQSTEKIVESKLFSVEEECAWKKWTPEMALDKARVITISLDDNHPPSHGLYLQDTYKHGGQLYGLSAMATIYSEDEISGESSTRQSPLVSNLRISVLD